MKKRNAGFTLIEILVVVTIIGILAATLVPRLMDRPEQARVAAAKSDIRSILSALKLYRLDHRVYPDTDQGLAALVAQPDPNGAGGNAASNGYLDQLPVDPWQHEYQYLNPGVHGEIDVFSYGADGQPGGDKFNADIGTWTLNEKQNQ